MIIDLLTNQANGNGDAVGSNADSVGSTPDPGTLAYYGTWDSATAKVQLSPDGGTTWIDIPSSSATANTALNLTAKRGFTYRGVVSGGGGSESINVKWAQ